MKKILSLLLAITLIFGVLPMSAFADEPNAEPATDIIDIIDDTVDDPVEDQTDPVEDPTEDPVEDPTKNPTDDPTDNPTNTINATNGGGMILVDSGDGCTCDSFCDDPDCVVCKDDPTQCDYYYCICEAVCAEGEANPDCPVCKDDYSKCAQAVEVPEFEAVTTVVTVDDITDLNIEIITFNNQDNNDDYTIAITTGFDTSNTAIEAINNTTNPNKRLIIHGNTGNIYTITRDKTGALFTVTKGELVLENIIIDGNKGSQSAAQGPLVHVGADGKLTMNDGATLQNNARTDSNSGGGVVVIGELVMNDGATIKDNDAFYGGGGVYVGFTSTPAAAGEFTMNGGTISGNTVDPNNMGGGGVLVEAFSATVVGKFTMNNGTISGNSAGIGGGVNICRIHNDITMSGGTISGNTAANGGGVYAFGTLNMSGGTISGNTSNGSASHQGGGGVAIGFNGKLNMSGNAAITSNTATNKGGGVLANSSSIFTVKDSAKVTDGAYLNGSGAGPASALVRAPGTPTNAKINITGALSSTASIGIEGMGVTDAGTIVATGAAAGDMAKFFISNAAGKIGDNNGFALSGTNIVLGTAAPPAPTPSSGGGSSKKEKPAPAPSPWLAPTPAQNMSSDAKQKDSDLVRTKSSDLYGVRKDAWQKLKGYRFIHDTMDGDTVGVRVSINEPEKIKQDLLVSGYVKGASANSRKAQFEKWFNNKIHVIHFDQNGAWGQPVGIAAKIDPNQFDSLNNLFLYSYDSTTGKYTRIERQSNHWLDNKGYLHFTTELAGDIIISEGPLEKK